uniref:Gamma interferon inducible lysosomal thiol reductase n=1 Tax=Steinernema glaseri TaxID=37863 RepID=A0A1I7ZQH7_9BILA
MAMTTRVALIASLLLALSIFPTLADNPWTLSPKQIEALNCLFLRSSACKDHLLDLSAASRIFWKTFGLTEQQNVIDTNVNTGNNVNLAVYMESQCPDTTRFIHKQLTPTWKLLSSTQRIDLTVVPFGKARCEPDGDDFKCQCQHGENECLLNQLMNCVIDQFGFPDKYIPVIDCIQGKPNLQIALKHCVDSNSLLSSDRMRTCAEGERGRRLLALAGQQTASLHPSLTFVPWITIDGKRVNDALYDLRENLCKRLDPMPEECNVTA